MSETPEEAQKPDFEFTSGRKNLVVDIGQGLVPIPKLRVIKEYLEAIDADYLGVDPDIKAHEQLKSLTKDDNWAASVNKSIFDLEGIDENVSEVWVRNFRIDLSSEGAKEIIGKIYQMLKPGGKAYLVDTYINYTPDQRNGFEQMLLEAGFSKTINVDLKAADIQNGFLAAMKRLDTGKHDFSTSIAVEVTK